MVRVELWRVQPYDIIECLTGQYKFFVSREIDSCGPNSSCCETTEQNMQTWEGVSQSVLIQTIKVSKNLIQHQIVE